MLLLPPLHFIFLFSLCFGCCFAKEYTTAPLYASSQLSQDVAEIGQPITASIVLLNLERNAKQASETFDFHRPNDIQSFSIRISRVVACASNQNLIPFDHDRPHRTSCYTEGSEAVVLVDQKRGLNSTSNTYITEEGRLYGVNITNNTLVVKSRPLQPNNDGIRLQIFWEVKDERGSIVVPENKMRRDVSAAYTGGYNTFESEVVYHASCRNGYVISNFDCDPIDPMNLPVKGLQWDAKTIVGIVMGCALISTVILIALSAKYSSSRRKNHINQVTTDDGITITTTDDCAFKRNLEEHRKQQEQLVRYRRHSFLSKFFGLFRSENSSTHLAYKRV